MKNEKEIEVVKKYQMSILQLASITGFFGGVIGTIFGYFVNYFNFTEINPKVILSPFTGKWTDGWLGFVVTALLYGLLSIVVALLYYMVLRKQKSLIWGAIYGIIIFLIIFLALHPMIPDIKWLFRYNFNTIATELCFFLIYGLFIGYSISYEYDEQLNWSKVNQKQ
ncbi:YqhR family membrane protein [Lederbergia wuyishanensis]|uniref:Membrane protein YagU involved in acid resistance n=1 Tax=Lederbergia wuyishanensis TaxID=1347903 RepID=A0ABU0D1A7_9BACI|nr:YqhR family membrane protein [Lederbergia wuyishanensis]MCJ8006804.1 YqhR family membrane protein [Lederbergia wuyishanensis]MDQ0342186.1 putative membrane protein YagU involved in acid resistance [Lederbergia wuyishanensis]